MSVTPSPNVLALMEAFVEAANAQDWNWVEELLTPTVAYHSPPHLVRFPGNVVARLQHERQAFPDLHLEIERSFASADETQGVAVVRWIGRRLPSRVCLIFDVSGGRIDGIESYGGLAKVFYDVGLLQPV